MLEKAVMKSRNGPHKAPFIGELAAQRRSEKLKGEAIGRVFFYNL